jgi:hypothetical protein
VTMTAATPRNAARSLVRTLRRRKVGTTGNSWEH